MSSKRRLRRKQCGRKARHASEADARIELRKIIQRMHGAVGPLSAYRCAFCGAWHVGHRSGQRRLP